MIRLGCVDADFGHRIGRGYIVHGYTRPRYTSERGLNDDSDQQVDEAYSTLVFCPIKSRSGSWEARQRVAQQGILVSIKTPRTPANGKRQPFCISFKFEYLLVKSHGRLLIMWFTREPRKSCIRCHQCWPHLLVRHRPHQGCLKPTPFWEHHSILGLVAPSCSDE